MAGKTNNTSKFAKQPAGQKPQGSAQLVGQSYQSINSPDQAKPAQNTGTALSGFAKPQIDAKSGYYDKDEFGDQKLGDPKTYDSVGSAGSGFVNMSHLLGLNKQSGMKSARDFASNVKNAGQGALSGIQSAEDRFTDASKAGMGWSKDMFDVGGVKEEQQGIIDSVKNAKYTGPNDLTAMGGYADLAKKVSSAQELAKNSQSATGMAAEVNKQTGLSPTQSAASSFYMGVNNPNIKRAGSAFTNLQSALDSANSRALASSAFARGEAGRMSQNAAGWQDELNAAHDPKNAAKTADRMEYDNLSDPASASSFDSSDPNASHTRNLWDLFQGNSDDKSYEAWLAFKAKYPNTVEGKNKMYQENKRSHGPNWAGIGQ